MRGQVFADEHTELFFKRLRGRESVLQDDEGFYDFGAQRVGLSNRRGQPHTGVFQQAVLNFTRARLARRFSRAGYRR